MSEAVPEDPRLRRAEVAASWCLRVGTLLSIALALLGVAMTLIGHPEWLGDPEAFRQLVAQDASTPSSLGEIAEGLRAFRGKAIIQAAVVCLILTPVLRVVVSAIAFLRAGDRLFATFAIVALLLLVAAFVAGGVH